MSIYIVHSVTKPRVCLCPSWWVTLCLYLFLTHPRSLHNPLGAHPHHQDHLPSWASHEEHHHYSQGSRLPTECWNVAFPSFSHWHHWSSCPRVLIRMLAWRRRLLMRSISASTGTTSSSAADWRTPRQSFSVLFSPWCPWLLRFLTPSCVSFESLIHIILVQDIAIYRGQIISPPCLVRLHELPLFVSC